MDQSEAAARAEAKLREVEDPANPLRLLDGIAPQEFPWAWTFLFNSVTYLETRDFATSVLSGPIVVNKDGSETWIAASAPPVEQWLNRYAEQHGYPEIAVAEAEHNPFG